MDIVMLRKVDTETTQILSHKTKPMPTALKITTSFLYPLNYQYKNLTLTEKYSCTS